MKDRPETQPKTILSRIRRLAIRWTLLYGIIVLVLALLQRKLIYQPTVVSDLSQPSAPPGQAVSTIRTTTVDGLTLYGWHWQSDTGDVASHRPVVLFFHGNGGNRSHRTYDCELFAECGADTIIFDYRGYGENPGKPTQDGLALDARAAWTFVTGDLGIAPDRVYLFGGSLGGGVAVPLAAELCANGTPPAGLMLRCTFSSMVETAAWHYPWLPVRWVLVDRFRSDEHAPQVTCPVLQMHGDDDDVVPLRLGRQLFERFPAQSADGRARRFLELPGANHNAILLTSREEVATATTEFLAGR